MSHPWHQYQPRTCYECEKAPAHIGPNGNEDDHLAGSCYVCKGQSVASIIYEPFDEPQYVCFLRAELELALKRAREAEESRDLIQKHANQALEDYRRALAPDAQTPPTGKCHRCGFTMQMKTLSPKDRVWVCGWCN